jgi:hypothetical protein
MYVMYVQICAILMYVPHTYIQVYYDMYHETLGLSMEFFKYEAVMPPKLGDVSKMTVE